jgi:hypothetical protein
MDVKINPWVLAALACGALIADPSLAARRGAKFVSHHGQSVSPGAGSPSQPGAAESKTGNDTATQSSGRPDSETGNSRGTKGGETASGKGGKSAGQGIDLVRPDDGYANLHRRAMRSSLIAAGQKKKLQIVPTVVATPHPPSPAGTPAEPGRNSAGVTLPPSAAVGKPELVHTVPGAPAPVNTGVGKNNLGLSVNETHHTETHITATGTRVPVSGINGTTMGRVNAGTVGGPMKDRSSINGSGYQHKF